ncbi:MAG: hypothetical protein ACK4ND_05140 [Cytophagaceae bacterium]
MNHYMIDICLPLNFDEGYKEKIPEQIEYIDELMDEEVIISYSVSVDQSRAWIIMIGSSKEEIIDWLSDFPLESYLKYTIHQLSAFSTNQKPEIPPFSIN